MKALLLSIYATLAVALPVSAQDSGDAIAVRVEKNPEYLSARDWYNRKGFRGSPQSVEVDGYAGVRDGRTVYVNAANVVASDDEIALAPDDAALAGKSAYANIYMLSYSNDAAPATQDIFGRMLKNWRFNTNLESRSGSCQGGKSSGSYCLIDADCSKGFHCASLKARLTRDIRRINDLSLMSSALAAYRQSHADRPPALSAGSYLKGFSLSVWPSWKDNLSRDIGSDLPIDPFNRLSSCPSPYNPDTCWDEKAYRFYRDSLKSAKVYAYRYESDSKAFFCSYFESPFSFPGIGDRKCPADPAAFKL